MKIIMKTMMLWTFLSITMGLEIHGEIIRGYPCIKRYNQLYCPTPGNNYPKDKINTFIDDNKALIRRMFGEFNLNVDDDDSPSSIPHDVSGEVNTTSAGIRVERATSRPVNVPPQSNRVDSCESSIEIVTPYWASNSAGKIRAVVNTQHFEQAIQQEVCQNVQTKRCSGDCSCEQKYKWHRLLSFDPEDDCKGIFMDWFLFPSCCVCKCTPTPKP